ncbi:MAG: helicase-related protein [Candidatus Hodarchaeales archaeon]
MEGARMKCPSRELVETPLTDMDMPFIPDEILFDTLFSHEIPASPDKKATMFAKDKIETILPSLGPLLRNRDRNFRARRTLERLTRAVTRLIILVSGTGAGKSHAVIYSVMEEAIRAVDNNIDWAGAVFVLPVNSLAVNLYGHAVKVSRELTGGKISCSLYIADLDKSERRSIREEEPNLLFMTPDMYIKTLAGCSRKRALDERGSILSKWERRLLMPSVLFFDEIDNGSGFTASCLMAVVLAVLELNNEKTRGNDFKLIIASATVPNAREVFASLFREKITVIEEPSVHGLITFHVLDSREFYHSELEKGSMLSKSGITKKYTRWELVIDRLVRDAKYRNVKALVYMDNRVRIEWLAARYKGTGDIVFLQAGRESEDNRSALKQFNSGEARIMVATSAVESGINIKGLNIIMLVGLPEENRSLLQRMGRAARDRGSRGSVFLFLDEKKEKERVLIENPPLLLTKLVDIKPEELVINLDNQHVMKLALLFGATLEQKTLAGMVKNGNETDRERAVIALAAKGALKLAENEVLRTKFTAGELYNAKIRRMEEQYPLMIQDKNGKKWANGTLNARELRKHALPGQCFYRNGMLLRVIDFTGTKVVATVVRGERGPGPAVNGGFLATNKVMSTITKMTVINVKETLPASLVKIKILEQVVEIGEEHAGVAASKTTLKMTSEVSPSGLAFYDRNIETEGVLVRTGFTDHAVIRAYGMLLLHWMTVLQLADRKDVKTRIMNDSGENRSVKGKEEKKTRLAVLFHDRLAPSGVSRAVYSNMTEIFAKMTGMVTNCVKNPHEMKLYLRNNHGEWVAVITGKNSTNGEKDQLTLEKEILDELAQELVDQ